MAVTLRMSWPAFSPLWQQVQFGTGQIGSLVFGEYGQHEDRDPFVVEVVDDSDAASFSSAADRETDFPDSAPSGYQIAALGVVGNHRDSVESLFFRQIILGSRDKGLRFHDRNGQRSHCRIIPHWGSAVNLLMTTTSSLPFHCRPVQV